MAIRVIPHNDSEVAFPKEEKDVTFSSFLDCVCFIDCIANQRSMSANFIFEIQRVFSQNQQLFF